MTAGIAYIAPRAVVAGYLSGEAIAAENHSNSRCSHRTTGRWHTPPGMRAKGAAMAETASCRLKGARCSCVACFYPGWGNQPRAGAFATGIFAAKSLPDRGRQSKFSNPEHEIRLSNPHSWGRVRQKFPRFGLAGGMQKLSAPMALQGIFSVNAHALGFCAGVRVDCRRTPRAQPVNAAIDFASLQRVSAHSRLLRVMADAWKRGKTPVLPIATVFVFFCVGAGRCPFYLFQTRGIRAFLTLLWFAGI